MQNTPVVFISYSHEDVGWKTALMEHLEGLAWTQSQMQVFVDSQMLAGDRFEDKISEAIANTSVAVLLLSPNFMRSRFIQEKELKPLLQRNEEIGMPLVPIVVEPCAWQQTTLSRFLVRPPDGQPLSQINERARKQILVDIAQEINLLYVQQIDVPEGIRILIADDQEYAVRGLKDLFNEIEDMSVIGQCRTAAEVEESVQKLVPDVILLDLSWYRTDNTGLELIQRIRKLSPTTCIIPISNYPELIEKAKQLGTSPLHKDFTMHQLFEHIRDVYSSYESTDTLSSLMHDLTPRETEILQYIGKGDTDKEIARQLIISESTVKKHVRNILAKTNARTRAEATAKATAVGVLKVV